MPVRGPATPVRKTLGAVGRTVKSRLLLVPPGVCSTMVALPTTSSGSSALIWRGDANSIGTGTPLTVRQESPNAVNRYLARGDIHGTQLTTPDGDQAARRYQCGTVRCIYHGLNAGS